MAVPNITLKRLEPDDDHIIGYENKLCWKYRITENQIEISCENGHVSFLQHRIAPDGSVTPSMQCPRTGCTWHVYGTLLDYKGELKIGS